MKIVHIITGLGSGGAESMLLKLVEATRDTVEQEIVSLVGGGELHGRFASLGLPMFCMDMRRAALPIRALPALRRLLAERSPDLVQTWMYHADLLGGIAARRARVARVVWNVRNSTLGSGTSVTTRLTVAACARLSHRIPDRIVSCSQTAARVHERTGYASDRFLVIPNGFDTGRFAPSARRRQALRDALGLPSHAKMIGFVARNDPQKDFDTMREAAARVLAKVPDAHLVVVGRGYEHDGGSRLHFLGHRGDIDAIMPAFDVLALSSSYGEAFPNVLGEAMSCGVPCVTTDVGDSARIVADTGIVVAPRLPEALAQGLMSILGLSPQEHALRSQAARQRIVDQFSLPAVAGAYVALWRELVSRPDRSERIARACIGTIPD